MKGPRIISRTSGIVLRESGLIVLLLVLAVCAPLSPASGSEISAKAAVVIDGNTEKILYAKNPHLKLPPASTTKLLTAMVVLDRLHPDTVVTVSENAANTPSVSPHLRPGERVTVRDLLYLSLMRSVNGAAVALAEKVAGTEEAFVRLMNGKAGAIGAEDTQFINATGLPGPGQFITAYDLTRVMKESLRYALISEVVNTRTKHIVTPDGRRIFLKNTNQLLWTDEDLLGGKTGYTRAAQHCFVCAAEKGETLLVAAVLGESARDGLWQEAAVMLSKGYDIVTRGTEPTIEFSSVAERKMVLAAYTPPASEKKVLQKKKTRSAEVKKKKTKRTTKTRIAAKSNNKTAASAKERKRGSV